MGALEQLSGRFDPAAWKAALDVDASAALVVFTAVPERSEAVFGLRATATRFWRRATRWAR